MCCYFSITNKISLLFFTSFLTDKLPMLIPWLTRYNRGVRESICSNPHDEFLRDRHINVSNTRELRDALMTS